MKSIKISLIIFTSLLIILLYNGYPYVDQIKFYHVWHTAYIVKRIKIPFFTNSYEYLICLYVTVEFLISIVSKKLESTAAKAIISLLKVILSIASFVIVFINSILIIVFISFINGQEVLFIFGDLIACREVSYADFNKMVYDYFYARYIGTDIFPSVGITTKHTAIWYSEFLLRENKFIDVDSFLSKKVGELVYYKTHSIPEILLHQIMNAISSILLYRI